MMNPMMMTKLISQKYIVFVQPVTPTFDVYNKIFEEALVSLSQGSTFNLYKTLLTGFI